MGMQGNPILLEWKSEKLLFYMMNIGNIWIWYDIIVSILKIFRS
jgi:hypothetical protein